MRDGLALQCLCMVVAREAKINDCAVDESRREDIILSFVCGGNPPQSGFNHGLNPVYIRGVDWRYPFTYGE